MEDWIFLPDMMHLQRRTENVYELPMQYLRETVSMIIS